MSRGSSADDPGQVVDMLTYARSEEVATTERDGGVTILDTQSWEAVELDNTAFAIWSLLEQPSTLQAIVDALLRQYDVGRPQCEADTRRFLDELVRQGIVTVAGAQGAPEPGRPHRGRASTT